MSRHPVADSEQYALVDYTNERHGVIIFVNFSAVNAHGYRGCGVFSCTPAEVPANVAAIKRGGVRVFESRTNAEGYAEV